jgi:hypothetical protein
MKTLKLAGILFVVLLFSKSAFALSANDLAKFTPDKISDFTATETAIIQDINKKSGTYHRVQRIYKSAKGLMCVIAIIEGAEVSNDINDLFPLERKEKTRIGNFEVFQRIPNNDMIQLSVKLGKQCLLTIIVLNTEDINVPIKVFNKLNLDGLAKIVSENDNTDK